MCGNTPRRIVSSRWIYSSSLAKFILIFFLPWTIRTVKLEKFSIVANELVICSPIQQQHCYFPWNFHWHFITTSYTWVSRIWVGLVTALCVYVTHKIQNSLAAKSSQNVANAKSATSQNVTQSKSAPTVNSLRISFDGTQIMWQSGTCMLVIGCFNVRAWKLVHSSDVYLAPLYTVLHLAILVWIRTKLEHRDF